MHKTYFITAIDTDAGKSVVTGALARYLLEKGVRVITQKMAQTGCEGHSEDIATHRRIMRCGPFPEDHAGLTCPYIFPFPAAPQLTAEQAGTPIDLDVIHAAREKLAERYECVLTEGVGGMMVPLWKDLTVADFMVRFPQPTILVTHGKLGSINHTLLTLEACSHRGVQLVGVVYNHAIPNDLRIGTDTLALFRRKLAADYPRAVLIEMPFWTEGTPLPDFSPLLEV